MKRFLAASLLWFSSISVFASSNDATNLNLTAAPATDLSKHYLSELFGNVSNVLPGHGAGLMGQLFHTLNQGILVVAAVWLMYTIFNMLLGAGLEGSLNHPQKKMTMIVFRIAIGLALLLPSSTTGYSAIQDLMMKVVVEGINLADMTWNHALDYLGNGGLIYSKPAPLTSQLTDYTNMMVKQPYAKRSESGPLQNILDAEIRMFLSNDLAQQKYNSNPKIYANYKSVAQTPYSLHFVQPTTTSAGEIDFPGLNPQISNSPDNDISGYVVAYNEGSNVTLADRQESYDAIKQMALDLQPLAKALANNIANGTDAPSKAQAAQTIATAAMDYMQLITPYARKQQQALSSSNTNFIANAKLEGWLGAGSFYWDLANLNDKAQATLDLKTYMPNAYSEGNVEAKVDQQAAIADANLGTGLVPAHSQPGSIVNDIWAQAILNIAADLGGASFGDNHAAHALNGGNHAGEIAAMFLTGGNPFAIALAADAAGDDSSAIIKNPSLLFEAPTPVNDEFSTGGVDFGSIIQDALDQVITTVGSAELNSNSGAFYDPLMFVQVVGHSCLNAAGSIWASSIVWLIGFAAMSGICSAVNPGSTVLNAMSSWLTPLWQASAGALFAAGFMMTFYAPLYPYLLFLFGVIGWLIYVIEAMVAAPLVAFGMTHPEGHDFVGRAEQALMLALGVFLRPVLMVIGFLSAMMLSYIAFSIVNFSFGQVLEETATSSHTGQIGANVLPAIWTVVNGSPTNTQSSHYTGHDLSDFLLIPLLMVFYGLIVIEVVNQCFSLIHVLPDTILRWIGGPMQQDTTEGYARQIQGGVSGAAKQGAQVAGQGATGFGSALGQTVVAPAAEMATSASLEKLADGLSNGGSGAGGDAAGAEDLAMLAI
jgi:defect-in-organelle-trafficking protein DotA